MPIPPVPVITGVTATAVPTISGPPHVTVSWDVAADPAPDIWAEYVVYRQDPVSLLYTAIAGVLARATNTYNDYVAPSGTDTYAITQIQVQQGTGLTVESALSAPASAALSWGVSNVIADVLDAPVYNMVLGAPQVNLSYNQTIAYQHVWGRQQPSAIASTEEWATLQFDTREFSNADFSRWNILKALMQRQRTLHSMQCLRMGTSGERYFTTIDPAGGLSRIDVATVIKPPVKLTETFFNEAVHTYFGP